MKIVSLEKKEITGISIRTSNNKEVNPQTAKIGALHRQFEKEFTVNYKNGARVYAAYYNYESDYTGDYSVLAGADKIENAVAENLEKIVLPAGTYMLFEAKGEVPKVVIETWMKIWAYFSTGDGEYQRSYHTDFEFYISQTDVEIYISVNSN